MIAVATRLVLLRRRRPSPLASVAAAVLPVRADVHVRLAQMAHGPLRDATVHDHSAIGVPLGQHFAVIGEQCQEPPVFDARFDVDVEKPMAQFAADGLLQLGNSLPCVGTNGHGMRIAAHQYCHFASIGRVNLVEHQQRVLRLNTQFFEHAVDHADLVERRRIAGIGHVQQQVGLARLFERGLEAGDQMVRQVANEAQRCRSTAPAPSREAASDECECRAWRTAGSPSARRSRSGR